MRADRRDVWNPSPVEEAARWALRRADAPLTPEEEAAFQAWLAADPDHRDSYRALNATLGDPALAEALAGLGTAPHAARRPSRPPMPRAIPGARRLLPGLALAACAALALVVVWPNVDRYMATPLRYETAAGQGRTVTLPDGTALNLNGDTVVEARLGHGHRWLTLIRGEAFFDVAHDSDRPFEIQAGDRAAITVLGTAFDIDLTRDVVELSVYRGRVRLSATGGRRELTAGQRADVHNGQLQAMADFNPTAEDWRQGWLETEGITLGRLAERLSRRSAVPIVLTDSRLAARQISGRFRLDDPARLLGTLGRVHGFTVERDADRLVLQPTA
ncbi:FecR family protein [Nitrospirillum sp. BR 11828]|uniref:FecR family protein n=1 Tax=Nitrospirillum sp. BR 11828 TaxID=3104325 RepID=UPI002ACA13BD|nr:FecR domain-containing protein [Nitrospirillum sp. BR 11828]MDZ5646074.1 FecR domain-containing protein [Nitrospirillum sp. BR 11828]